MSEALQTLAELARARGVELWLVGGFVRDVRLGRSPPDADLVLRGAVPFARRAARALRGAFVLLDEEWDTARVVVKRGRPQPLELDFAEMRGDTLAEDLACRDFTINAMACSLPEFLRGPEPALTDPFHGAADLAAGVLRAVSPEALQADPLRAVRAYRFAAQLGFVIVPGTQELIRAAAPRLAAVAVERITAELFKLLSTPRAAEQVRELVAERVLAAVLPEAPWEDLAAATLALAYLEEALAEPEAFFPEAAERVQEWVETSSHRPILKWALLWDGLLDVPTLQAVAERLRWSREQQRLWQTLATFRNAPRAALLRAVGEVPGTHTRAILCRYFSHTGEAGVGGVLIQWAHLRACGEASQTTALTEAAGAALRLYTRELEPLLRRPRLLTGRDLQRELSLPPGPRFKALLAAVRQAELMGEVTTREEALGFVRRRKGSASDE